ncbi:signal peptidase II [Psychromicrobium lacuslunae]|uniref:Lipoprotein signal peptidase n=1 Tax=Psychromicrobium lacuslunae TaxID=1618207 RepID=A0A0D4BX74_9MICC|nr:signal peptidase II [Psychromicrobium lacuslunae]AJT40725.1 lipoprotein signal peptidase [Psychromicrobium lacuslunae]
MTENPAPAERKSSANTARWILICCLAGLAVLAYGLDQLTKFWVTSTMTLGQVTEVWPPVLRWYYITNSGAAFSIGEGYTWIFSIVMTVVSIAIIVLARKVGSVWWAIAMGMVLGGALGNLTDRLFRPPSFGMGHVVDFISVPNFAIFNLADSAVVGGVIVICLLTLIGVPFRGGPRRVGEDARRDADKSTDSAAAAESADD